MNKIKQKKYRRVESGEMSRRGRSEEEEKNEEKMMLRDAGSTSNRDPARGGRSVGVGHGWRRGPIKTGYM